MSALNAPADVGAARGEIETPDPRPGFYYVSAIDGPRAARVQGPFQTHAEALARVDAARSRAEKLDPRACWYAFGTCRSETDLGPGWLDTIGGAA